MRNPIPFGRHLLLERINVGGMAEVFRAKSFGVEGFERIVAVKRILPQMSEDEEFIKMFKDEARIASQLTHQNIVQIYELGKELGVYFISMEYVTGRDLRLLLDRFKRQRRLMSEAMAAFIISRVCESLDYAHRKRDPSGKEYKIIHRDVSPQNVLISFEGECKLCDFGIAKAVTQSTRTQAGVLKGKFAYMSPEQVRGQPIDRRSDLFALGVIFYEMLTGERLFLGESDFSTLEAVRAARIPNPRQFNRDLPKPLERILMRMLARNPARRFQWASEIHEELHEYLAKTGQIYHAHHLRQFMQEAYAREIEIENKKLEEFMSVKRPVVEDEGDDPPEAAAVAAIRKRGSPPKRVVRGAPAPEEIRTDIGPSAYDIPEGFVPEAMTTEAGDRLQATERAMQESSDSKAPVIVTQMDNDTPWDSPSGVHGGVSQTQDQNDQYTDENATVMVDGDDPPDPEATLYDDDLAASKNQHAGSLHAEIQAAQAELIERLEAEGALDEMDDGETVDAVTGTDDDVPMPSVVTPPPEDESIQTGTDERMPSLVEEEGPNDTYVVEADDDDDDDATKEEFDDGIDWDAFAREQNATISADTNDGEPPLFNDTNRASAPNRQIRERKRTASVPTRGPSLPASRPVTRPKTPPQPPARARRVASRQATPPPRDWSSTVQPLEGTGASSRGIAPPRSLADPRVLMGLAAIVGVMALILLAVVVMRGRPAEATLTVMSSPTTDVSVFLDKKLIADKTPVEIGNLGIGKHTIEVRANGWQTYRQVFEIAEARPHTLNIPLEKGKGTPAAKPWSVRVTSVPPGAAVTIGGRLAGVTPVEHAGLKSGQTADVVIELAGYLPYSKSVDPPADAGAAVMVTAKLEARPRVAPKVARAPAPKLPPPVPAPKEPEVEKPRVVRQPVAPVGQPRIAKPERKPPPVKRPDDPPPRKPEAKPEPKPPPKPAPTPAPKPEKPAIAERKPPPPRPKPKAPRGEVGFLLISTSPARVPVVIDGKQTGLKTPVRKPYALPPGTHVVTLVGRSGKAYEFKVTISPGGTTKLVKRLR